jgi:hypothetical protein
MVHLCDVHDRARPKTLTAASNIDTQLETAKGVQPRAAAKACDAPDQLPTVTAGFLLAAAAGGRRQATSTARSEQLARIRAAQGCPVGLVSFKQN